MGFPSMEGLPDLGGCVGARRQAMQRHGFLPRSSSKSNFILDFSDNEVHEVSRVDGIETEDRSFSALVVALASDDPGRPLAIEERNYPVAFGCIAGKDRTGGGTRGYHHFRKHPCDEIV